MIPVDLLGGFPIVASECTPSCYGEGGAVCVELEVGYVAKEDRDWVALRHHRAKHSKHFVPAAPDSEKGYDEIPWGIVIADLRGTGVVFPDDHGSVGHGDSHLLELI